MYMPNLLRNFFYVPHRCGVLLMDVIMALVSSEVHCAANFCRRFFWTSKLLNLCNSGLNQELVLVRCLYTHHMLARHFQTSCMAPERPFWREVIHQSVFCLLGWPASSQLYSNVLCQLPNQ
jgi:hypothetical protein